MAWRRVVVKVGSSSLTEDSGALNLQSLAKIAHDIAAIHPLQGQVILVTSGAVAAGIKKLEWQRASITIPEKQAAAAVGQGLLIDAYQRLLAAHGVTIAQLLLTRSDIEDRKRFLHIRNTLETLLRHSILPVINENDSVAVEEIRFGDNDTLASLVALLVQADVLILLTDTDGLYTANPRIDPTAKLISHVRQWSDTLWQQAGGSGTKAGTGGMRTKLRAAQIASEAGIDTIIAGSSEQNVIRRILSGEEVGTHFHSLAAKRSDKRTWLRLRSHADGELLIDAGAALALRSAPRSLLLPGIVEVRGHFQEGAVVDVISSEQGSVARGTVNFSATDLQLLMSRHQAGESLAIPAVIHRNELVVWNAIVLNEQEEI